MIWKHRTAADTAPPEVTDVVASVHAVPLQSGSGEWSGVFALIIGIAFLAAVTLIILYNRWNRPDMDPEHAAHILAQLNTFGGTRGGSVVVRSVAALQDPDVLQDIRGLFHGEPASEPTARTATREALGEILREVRTELGDRKPSVSKVPARAIQEAVLTLIFGAIAVVPIAAWREASETGGGGVPDIGDILTGGQIVLDAILGAVTAFPYTDALFAFGLTFGILGAELIWTLWMVPPLILAVLAGTYWYLERRLDVEREVSGPPIRAWARRFVVLAAVTWFVGSALAFLAGVNPFGILTGVIAAAITVSVYVYLTRSPPIPEQAVRTDGGEDDDGDDGGLGDLFGSDDGEDELDSEVYEYTAGEDADDADGHGTFAVDSPSADTAELADAPEDLEIAREGEPEDADDGEDGDDGPSLRLRDHFRDVNWKRAALFGILAFGIGAKPTAFLAAFAVAATVTGYWTRKTLARWRRVANIHGRDALALDIVHSLTVTAAALTLPLLIGYVLAAIGTGKILQVASVVLSAPSATVSAVGLLAVVAAIAAAVILLDRFRDVRRGIRRALSVQSVRTVVFARAFPAIFSAVIAILALGLGVNPVAAVAVALSAGIIARIAYMAYNYMSFRARNRTGRDKSAARVVISGRQVTDADGEPVYVADVNGHRTAHRRLDPLITQIRRDGRSLLRDGRAEKGSFPRYYYKEGVTRGKVDMDAMTDELIGDIRTRFIANVKQTDADAPDIMDKLNSEYPPHAVQTVVQTLKDRGRVTRRDDQFQWMGE